MTEYFFDHDRLDVYRLSIDYVRFKMERPCRRGHGQHGRSVAEE
jgi:hypothetical protein